VHTDTTPEQTEPVRYPTSSQAGLATLRGPVRLYVEDDAA